MSNFGSFKKSFAVSRLNVLVLLMQSADKLLKREVLKDTNTKC